jgi:hypothetical protein
MIKAIYRLSDHGYNKEKPDYVNNHACLNNFIMSQAFFSDYRVDLHIICDNVSDETYESVSVIANTWACTIERTFLGSGAQSFNHALNLALTYDDSDVVYFVEDDYIHNSHWGPVLLDGFTVGADYVSLYDHPDKYINADVGGNPYVFEGGEVTRVLCGNRSHWKLSNSTTMTFASTVKTLREDEVVLRRWTKDTHPHDFNMFLELRDRGRALATPIPAYATHGETQWLSPLVSWEQIMGK